MTLGVLPPAAAADAHARAAEPQAVRRRIIMSATTRVLRFVAKAGIAAFLAYFSLCLLWFLDALLFDGRYLSWSHRMLGHSEASGFFAGLAVIVSVLILCLSLLVLGVLRRAERNTGGKVGVA
jgi:hypothetical protein